MSKGKPTVVVRVFPDERDRLAASAAARGLSLAEMLERVMGLFTDERLARLAKGKDT